MVSFHLSIINPAITLSAINSIQHLLKTGCDWSTRTEDKPTAAAFL